MPDENFAYGFCPAESQEKRGVSNGKRELNDRYDRRTYRKAVQYAIRKAQKEGVKVGNRGVMMWTPHPASTYSDYAGGEGVRD